MPKYDYKCTNCEVVSTQQHKMFDAPQHSTCCDAPVVKVYHATPVTFKGNGFYKTDNRTP